MKNIFAEYDRKVPEPLEGHLEIRKKMIDGSGWTPEDGKVRGVFESRLPEACIWSANWATSEGLIAPVDYYGIEFMKSGELLAEASDLMRRWPQHAVIHHKLMPLMSDYFAQQIAAPNPWIERLKMVIQDLRQIYVDFICSWDPPPETGFGMVMQKNFRPGWTSDQIETPTSEHTPVTWSAVRRAY